MSTAFYFHSIAYSYQQGSPERPLLRTQPKLTERLTEAIVFRPVEQT